MNISKVITEICHKLGVDYNSPFLDQYKEDLKTLADIYLQLKQIVSQLYEIEKRYSKVNHLRQVLEEDISLLLKIDHDIIKEVQELKKIREEE